MSEESNKTKTLTKVDLEAKKQQVVQKRQELQQSLIQLTEQKIEDRFSDKSLDRQNEKIKLVSGIEIDINVLSSEWQRHDPQYTVEFYAPVFRLLSLAGDPASFTDRFNKQIADFKNAVIWGRFKKDSFQQLRRKNKYSGYYIRKHWHYQGLNDAGIEKLQTYIQQATDLMAVSATYYEFRQKMYDTYGLGYQIQTF